MIRVARCITKVNQRAGAHLERLSMNQEFQKVAERMEPMMDQLRNSDELSWEDRRVAPKQGVYVLYEGGKPVYVGRSNRLRDRIYEHGADSSDRHSATFAVKLLRKKLNHPKGKAADLVKDNAEEYDNQKMRVQKMTFRAIEIKGQLEQTLFEVYVILEFRTQDLGYNDFDTH